jgi:hypothetical protein
LIIELDFGSQGRVANLQQKRLAIAGLGLFQDPEFVIERGGVPPRRPQAVEARVELAIGVEKLDTRASPERIVGDRA